MVIYPPMFAGALTPARVETLGHVGFNLEAGRNIVRDAFPALNRNRKGGQRARRIDRPGGLARKCGSP